MSKPMRVAFVFSSSGDSWMGGINYLRSLFHAMRVQRSRQLSPVIILSPDLEKEARERFPDVEIIVCKLLQRWSLPNIFRKIGKSFFRYDFLLDRFLRRRGIPILSHGTSLGPGAKTKTLVWVPDFQHVHLPHFFSKEVVELRNRSQQFNGTHCTLFIVSSESAAKDARAEIKGIEAKVRVLRFSPAFVVPPILPVAELKRIYQFEGEYLFLPNQAWAHKNHLTVISAVHCLKKRGVELLVLCTGSKQDPRNPSHGAALEKAIADHDVSENFRMLGMVPYDHMISLMFHCKAVVNPSLFEGWSTTVEEAKLMEKPLILSDIEVHREQAEGNAVYFAAQSAEECAGALSEVWAREANPCMVDLETRIETASMEFGRRYAEIVQECLEVA